ncbi:MAG: hypothetical protein H7Y38_09510 [Armatimonadetes bacterium]|nr:hypothetical protein [Armatimonadota bacterium]
MKYTFTLLVEGDDSRREKIVLESRSSESPRHIVQKILAYLLYRDLTGGLPLRIEPGEVGQRHRPDLLATETAPFGTNVRAVTDKPLLWIDCGQIETKRLGRIAAINRDARVIIVKQTGREAQLYAEAARKDLPVLNSGTARFVGYLGFDDGFMADLVNALRGANTFCLTEPFTEALSLTMNDAAFSSHFHAFDYQASPLSPADFWDASTLPVSVEK